MSRKHTKPGPKAVPPNATKGNRAGVAAVRRLNADKRKQEAAAELENERTEFERRQRAQVERAALDLDPTDVAIFRLAVQYPHLTQGQIGDLVGLGREAVNARMNAPKFARAVGVATQSAIEILDGNKAKAARKLGELIDNPDARIAIRAAIAHLWPHIHATDTGKSGGDFVSFIQEAYELANAQNPDLAKPAG